MTAIQLRALVAGAVSIMGVIAAAFPATAQGGPSDKVVGHVIFDYRAGGHSEAQKEAATGGGKSSSSTCPLPPTDLCTDYVFGGNRWTVSPIPYYINEANAPLGFAQDIQDAFATWENELKSAQVEAFYPDDRSTVQFVYMGPTTRLAGTRDGANVVSFRSSNCTSCWAYVSYWTRRKAILESDITFNLLGDANENFMTDLTCPTLNCNKGDIQSIAVHEIGHVLNLFHVSAEADSELVMYPYLYRNETKWRSLGAGDVLGAREGYPAN